MVSPVYLNKTGIYKDLYRQIDSDNKNRESSEVSYKRRPRGIYADLYKQFENDNNQKHNQNNIVFVKLLQFIASIFDFIALKSSVFFSSAKTSVKMLILGCVSFQKPIHSYVTNYAQSYYPKPNKGYNNER